MSIKRARLARSIFIAMMLAAPASAQHRARLSADLADHLTAGSQTIDVIVHGNKAEVDALAARYNVVVKRYLKNEAVLRVNAGQLAALQHDDAVDHLSGDIRLYSSADVTATTIGADQVWEGRDDAPGLSGNGVGVAVIDSGIDPKHHALQGGRVIASHDFTGGDGVDRFGHGTHVAAIIAGRASQSQYPVAHRGIASGASIINLRVLGDDGSGTVSNVIEAIDWAIDHRRQYNIHILNLSLGTQVLQPYRDDPLCEAVERAVRKGLIVVVSAGNYGRTKDGKTVLGSVSSPGNSPYAITVGALDTHDTPQRSDDTVAGFSSRGPTMYDLVLKPDLVAPGRHVVSAEASGSYLATTYPERHVDGSGPDAYMQLSGTSMAAGVVSGSVALLLEQKPGLKPRDVRAVLQVTSSFMPAEGLVGAGAGSLNVLAATQLTGAPKSSEWATTVIGGERAQVGGLVFSEPLVNEARPHGDRKALSQPNTIVWSLSAPDTIVWSLRFGDTIVWSLNAPDTIVWSLSAPDTIVWSLSAPDTIVWSLSAPDTIVWSLSAPDTIVWSLSAPDTIVWSLSAPDTIGGPNQDTIVWGLRASDTIILGLNASDTIVWGLNQGDTIIWSTYIGLD